jgi:hypothetical protein
VVLVGSTPLPPSNPSATSLTVTLPAALPAGTQTAQVVQQPLLGSPPVPHGSGVQSVPFAFSLSPLIRRTGNPSIYQVTVLTGVGSPPSDTVAVTLDPAVQIGQRSVLLLLPQTGGPPTLFDGGAATTSTNTLVFAVGIPPSGSYFVQVIVDGAESPLDANASGQSIGPGITL